MNLVFVQCQCAQAAMLRKVGGAGIAVFKSNRRYFYIYYVISNLWRPRILEVFQLQFHFSSVYDLGHSC